MLRLCSENRRISEAVWKTGCNSFRLAWCGQVVLHVFNTSEFEKFSHASHQQWICDAACKMLVFICSLKYHQRRNELQVKSVSQHQSVQTKYLYFELISWTNKSLTKWNYCMNLRKLILHGCSWMSVHPFMFTEPDPKNKRSTCAKWFLFDLLLSQKHTEYTSS